jgi:hypothetical protein
VSERLLLNANSAIFQQYKREQVNFQWDDDEIRFVLDQHAELDFYRNKDWLARKQDNVSECSDMSIRGLLFQLASSIKIQLSMLV